MNLQNSIYLDACSTSPTSIEVIELVHNIQLKFWGNPSNIHKLGVEAAEILERSRLKMTSVLNAEYDDLIFTSGASESIYLSIVNTGMATSPGRIVISSVEHPSVIKAASILESLGWELDYWPVDSLGNLELDYIDKMLKPPTKLVSLIWGQSEIGTIQPVEIIGQECRRRNILFHVDASQYINHAPISWNSLPVDYLSASSHKFRGPRGVGLLLRRSNNIKRDPLQNLTHQEFGIRAGTEPVSLIAGMALALELLYEKNNLVKNDKNLKSNQIQFLTQTLRNKLTKIKNIKFTGDPYNRLNNHISMLIGNSQDIPISSRSLVLELSKKGIYASSGSACTSSSSKTSHVLKAINIEEIWQQSALRFSLGSWLTLDDINKVPKVLIEIMKKYDLGN